MSLVTANCTSTKERGLIMRKYVETLVNSATSYNCGNHAVMLSSKTVCILDDRTGKEVKIAFPSRVFTYHGNVICVVSDYDHKFWLSHAGWFCRSTTQALNQYREYFLRRGYKCMTD